MRQRKSIRLKCWNYSNDGIYFITICTKDKSHWFGDVENGEMVLNNCGKIAKKCWSEIPNHFKKVELGEFVVMPNHIHGLIEIKQILDSNSDNGQHSKRNQNRRIIGMQRPNPLQNRRDIACNVQNNQQKRMLQCNIPTGYFSKISPKSGSISTIIRSFKSICSKKIHKINADFKWQSRFYDHIIRDETDYEAKHYYIVNNPNKWGEDKYNRNGN